MSKISSVFWPEGIQSAPENQDISQYLYNLNYLIIWFLQHSLNSRSLTRSFFIFFLFNVASYYFLSSSLPLFFLSISSKSVVFIFFIDHPFAMYCIVYWACWCQVVISRVYWAFIRFIVFCLPRYWESIVRKPVVTCWKITTSRCVNIFFTTAKNFVVLKKTTDEFYRFVYLNHFSHTLLGLTHHCLSSRRDGVVVNTLASRLRGPRFNS